MRTVYNWTIGTILTITVIGMLAWAFGPPKEDPIPTPGPGQHYCATSNTIGICDIEETP